MQRYFIGLAPTKEAQRDLHKLKKRVAQETQALFELENPVHVTLVPPFTSEDTDWMDIMQDVAASWEPFSLQPSGFGHFRERTLFVDVNDTPEIQPLREDLLDALQGSNIFLGTMRQKEHYHITLARKDLSPKACQAFLEKRQTVVLDPIPVDRLRAWVHMDGEWLQAADAPLGS